MKILAFDSSSMVASVALLEETQVIAEYTMNYKKTHSQTLLPMLDEIVKMTQTDLSTVDYIAVAGGPGSFTGLRIGSATVKGLGLALDKPVVNVPTLEGLAVNLYGTDHLICPMMDARRNQVFTGIYCYEQDELKVIMDQSAMDIHDLIARVNEENRPVIFLGDGVDVQKNTIVENIKVSCFFAPAHLAKQRAAAVGIRAVDYVRAGKVETAMEHKPEYLRVSQAERERMEKENAGK